MAFFEYYIDNVDGTTGGAGTSADPFFSLQEGFDGASANAGSEDLTQIFIKETGLTYQIEGIGNLGAKHHDIRGTSADWSQDGSRPIIHNVSANVISDTVFNDDIRWTNFRFNTLFADGMFRHKGRAKFVRCEFEGNNVTNGKLFNISSGSLSTSKTFIDCTFRNFDNYIDDCAANRPGSIFYHCFLFNAPPYKTGGNNSTTPIIVNCLLVNSELYETNYGSHQLINNTFVDSPIGLFDRTSSSEKNHTVINNTIVNSHDYGIISDSNREGHLPIVYKNFFSGNVSGNYYFPNMSGLDIPNRFYETNTEPGGQSAQFVDESAGGTGGYRPTATSPQTDAGIKESDTGFYKQAIPAATGTTLPTIVSFF